MTPTLFRLAVLLLAAAGTLAAHSISASAQTIVFNGEVNGGPAGSETITVFSNPTDLRFGIDVSGGDNWLSVSPTSGVTTASVTVSADTSNISSAGQFLATLRISMTDFPEFDPWIVTVVLNVADELEPPLLSVAPTAVELFAVEGARRSNDVDVTVFNEGGGSFTYVVNVTYPAGQPMNWLTVTPTSCSIANDCNNFSHVVFAQTQDLPEGTYRATLTFDSDDGGDKNVAVTLSVTQPPIIFPEPFRLTFESIVGQPPPPVQALLVDNAGDALLTYSVTVDQPWLRVTPLAGQSEDEPFEHQVSVNPQGLAPGEHIARITLTSTGAPANNSPLVVVVLLTVKEPGTISAAPAEIGFESVAGMPSRFRRAISIVSPELAGLRWSASVEGSAAGWLRLLNSAGTVPSTLLVEVETAGFGAGVLNAEILIEAGLDVSAAPLRNPGSATVGQEAGSLTARVPVTLEIANAPPQLQVEPPALRFIGPAGAAVLPWQQLAVDNSGGPSLGWTGRVRTQDGGDWLHLLPGEGTAPSIPLVQVRPGGLPPGVYQGTVSIESGPQKAEIPVTMLLSGPGGALLELSQAGIAFEAVEGTGALPGDPVRILNMLPGTSDWTASVMPDPSAGWLAISPAQGNTSGGAPGPNSLLRLTPNATGLAPGVHSLLVAIDSPQAANGRQFLPATLNVLPAETPGPLAANYGGVLLQTAQSAPPAVAETVRAYAGAAQPQDFAVGVSTLNGGEWLAAEPREGTTSAINPAQIVVRPVTTELEPGTYYGLASIAFSNGAIHSVGVTLIVTGGGCRPSRLVVSPQDLPQGFRVAAGQPAGLRTLVTDNCGARVNDAAVLARFLQGGAALPLHPAGDGFYHGTWTPPSAAAQVNVAITARNAALDDGMSVIVGEVTAGDGPLLAAGGVVSGASFARGAPLAPGSIVSAFGANLAASTAQAGAVPLPREVLETSVWIGGVQAPLFFVSSGQINAQIPFETPSATLAQVMVERGGRRSTPQSVVTIESQPGLFMLDASIAGPGRAVAQNQDFTINTPQNPEARGRVLTVFLTGQGPVEPAVETGAAAPAEEPFARATLPAQATIGGVESPILFLGLTPGFVGLLQANIQIPENAPAGSNVPLEITIGGQPGNILQIAVAAP